MKARCGGPASCSECERDLRLKDGWNTGSEGPPPHDEHALKHQMVAELTQELRRCKLATWDGTGTVEHVVEALMRMGWRR